MIIADRYETIGDSLAGGMAAGLPCNDLVLKRKVAIKIMPGGAAQRRIQDELAALLRMRSKHVVQVYDVLRVGANDLAIVQEFIEGNDLLDDSLAPATTSEYLKLLWQISSGIADIHALDLIHRDIKPNNMKVDPEGVVKIFDFGLAREEGPAAATVGFVGTPGFAAPELYVHHASFTAAVDTYAFGATALYLGLRNLPPGLRRHPPVYSSSSYFSGLPIALPVEVADLLDLCLAPAPGGRPAIEQVRDVLAKHLLHDRHKALVVFQGAPSYLGASRRSVMLRLADMGEVAIRYDGFCFRIDHVAGDVFVNNVRAAVGHVLPGACVVALGGPEHMARRKYVTFDSSHPEIVL